MNILIVEDTDARINVFKKKLIGHFLYIAKNAKDAYALLEKEEKFDYAFLDHDLQSVYEEPSDVTGYGVAKWISEHPEKAPRHICIHSLNNIGAARMLAVLGDVGIRARYVPFAWMLLTEGSAQLEGSVETEEQLASILDI
jgi:CheY-like chemotaxis protein